MAKDVSYQRSSEPTISELDATMQTGATVRSLPVWIILPAGIVTGLVIAILWQASIADKTVGFTIANTILPGSSTQGWIVADAWVGLLFAIAAGLGTTFTACNCVVFSCIIPLSNQKGRAHMGIGRLLMWMAFGVVVVTASYGIVGSILEQQVPSLSAATLPFGSPQHIPIRLLQSSAVFVSLGLVLLYWGMVSLRLVDNPLRKFAEQRPWIVPLSFGVIVGFFTVGRPYPLFHLLFQYSAGTGNPLLSAVLIGLQGLCNIALMSLLLVLLVKGTGGRFERWMQAHPLQAKNLSAFSVIGGGTFLVAYWGIRLFAEYGIGWFPHI